MDKKVVKNNKKYKLFATVVLAVSVIAGLTLFAFGIVKLCGYQAEMGDKPVEQINKEIEPLAKEYREVQGKAIDELNANGASDKYIEYNNKANELNSQISKLSNSRFMKETGYHNPRTVKEAFELAPTLWIGAIVLVAGFVAFVILRQLA